MATDLSTTTMPLEEVPVPMTLPDELKMPAPVPTVYTLSDFVQLWERASMPKPRTNRHGMPQVYPRYMGYNTNTNPRIQFHDPTTPPFGVLSFELQVPL